MTAGRPPRGEPQPGAPPTPFRLTLTVIAGPHQGRCFRFGQHDTFVVGRSPDVHFSMPEKDPYFSRLHFMVEVNPPLCRLVDLGSHNGTYVRGQKVDTVDLKDGDLIKAGHTILRVTLEKLAASDPTHDLPPSAAPHDLVTLLPSRMPVGTAKDESVKLPAAPDATGTDLAGHALADLRQRWEAGQRVPAEVYLREWPTLLDEPEAVLDLIYGEFVLREELGDKPRPEEYFQRFPAYAKELERQFEVHGGLAEVSQTDMPQAAAPLTSMADASSLAAANSPGESTKPPSDAPPSPARRSAKTEVSLEPNEGPADGFPTIPGYALLAELGRGGMGIVYKGRSLCDGALVAIKTILPAVKPTEIVLQRFLREAGILRELQHPHIVPFREIGEAEGLLYFAMEFIPGTDAACLLQTASPLPVGRSVYWICQLLEALAYAHDRGFVHRDIKPGNLLITQRDGKDFVCLADFGLARTYQGSQLSGLTLVGVPGGTPSFMPPEQVLDFRSVKPSADQYAAAATLYNLLTARHVYEKSTTIQELFQRILKTDPVPIQSRRGDVPAALAAAVQRGLARKPEDRFPHVKALRQALLPFAKA